MTIDDKLPYIVKDGAKQLRFAKESDGAWWGPIIEKAGAKFFGTYSRLSRGWMKEAFYVLTGMPTFGIAHKNYTVDALWNTLKKWDEDKWMINPATIGGKNNVGLMGGHAYTAIGVHEYNGENLV